MRCAEPWAGAGWHTRGSLFPAAPQVLGGALPIPALCFHQALPPKLSPATAPSCERMGLGWRDVTHSIWGMPDGACLLLAHIF